MESHFPLKSLVAVFLHKAETIVSVHYNLTVFSLLPQCVRMRLIKIWLSCVYATEAPVAVTVQRITDKWMLTSPAMSGGIPVITVQQ